MYQCRHKMRSLDVGWCSKVNEGEYLKPSFASLMVLDLFRIDEMGLGGTYIASMPSVLRMWSDNLERLAVTYDLNANEIPYVLGKQWGQLDSMVREGKHPPTVYIKQYLASVRSRGASRCVGRA